jgi:hypothetical protein
VATYLCTETEFAYHNWKIYGGNRECPVEEEPAGEEEPVEEERGGAYLSYFTFSAY